MISNHAKRNINISTDFCEELDFFRVGDVLYFDWKWNSTSDHYSDPFPVSPQQKGLAAVSQTTRHTHFLTDTPTSVHDTPPEIRHVNSP